MFYHYIRLEFEEINKSTHIRIEKAFTILVPIALFAYLSRRDKPEAISHAKAPLA